MLFYLTKPKCLEGPFFISVTGETTVVLLNRGRIIFRKTCVKPLVTSIIIEHLTTHAADE